MSPVHHDDLDLERKPRAHLPAILQTFSGVAAIAVGAWLIFTAIHLATARAPITGADSPWVSGLAGGIVLLAGSALVILARGRAYATVAPLLVLSAGWLLAGWWASVSSGAQHNPTFAASWAFGLVPFLGWIGFVLAGREGDI